MQYDDLIENKKMPLQTIDKKNCLTKCNEKGKPYINPITLDKIFSLNNSSCAIIPTKKNKPEEEVKIIYDDVNKYHLTVTGNYNTWGVCNLEDNDKYHVPSEKDSMLLVFYFDPYDFLTQIYDLHTFNQVITWTLENMHLHFKTMKRVHNASWKVFGSDISNISDLVIDFYYDIARNKWMKDYVGNISKKYSFDILSDSIPLEGEDTKGSITDTTIENIIIRKFFDKHFFVQIIKKYLNEFKNIWTNIDSHYKNLKNFTYKCIMKNIKFKLNNSTSQNKNINL